MENIQAEEIIEVGKANRVALLMFIPIAICGIVPFGLIHGFEALVQGFNTLKHNQLYLLIGFLATVIIHEGIHGITWALFAKKGLKSISFGIKWSHLTPYCHCSETLNRNHYILGGIMPGVVTGLAPLLISYATANGWLLLISVFLIATAVGDFMVIKRVLKYSPAYRFLDHPTEIGFIVKSPTYAEGFQQ